MPKKRASQSKPAPTLRKRTELGHSRDRFNDLYDFAPVGYVTLDDDGTVIEASLTAATMLGVERNRLVGRKFTRFVAPSAQDTLYLHRSAVFDCDEKQACDILLRRADGTQSFARMETASAIPPRTRGTAGARSSTSTGARRLRKSWPA